MKKAHFQKLRAAFTKAGFRKDHLAGDDFCARLLGEMMERTRTEKAGKAWEPFVGRLEVTPDFEMTGAIRIDFNSDELREFDRQYTGWFFLNPDKFNRKWLQEAKTKHINAIERGDGIRMELDDGTPF